VAISGKISNGSGIYELFRGRASKSVDHEPMDMDKIQALFERKAPELFWDM
jgi:hypothetical protein